MASGLMMKILCIMVACMVVTAPYATAITCGDVVGKLTPCLKYLQGKGSVSTACCKGVKGLHGIAKTSSEKKTACDCMKKAYKSVKGIKTDKAVGLPKKCGVNIPYKFSPDTDCSKVK